MSRQSAWRAPASDGGLLRVSSTSSFCDLLSLAAFSPPARPITTELSLVRRHCDSHSRTVTSTRSTISATVSRTTPRQVHRYVCRWSEMGLLEIVGIFGVRIVLGVVCPVIENLLRRDPREQDCVPGEGLIDEP